MIKDYYAQRDYGVFTPPELHEIADSLPGDVPFIVVNGDHAEEIECAESFDAVMSQPWAHHIGHVFRHSEYLGGAFYLYTADMYSVDVEVAHSPGLGMSWDIESVFDAADVASTTQWDNDQHGKGMNTYVVDSASWAAESAQDPDSDDWEPMGHDEDIIDIRLISNDHFTVVVIFTQFVADKQIQ